MEKNEVIKKLIESRENINLLFNMLKSDQWKIEQKLKLAKEAKRIVDSILYDLTSNEFYRNEEDNNENKSVSQQG